MPPFCLDDRQLALVMDAAKPLPPDKRTAGRRIFALAGLRRPGDQDIAEALRIGLRGLMQGAA